MKASKKGTKINFYTQDQVKELMTAIESKEFKNERALALAYSKKFDRSYAAVYSKVRYLNGKKPERIVVEKKIESVRFTEEQMNQLTLAIQSNNYKSNHSIAKTYAEKFGKSVDTVYAKIRRMIGTKVSVPGGVTYKTKKTSTAIQPVAKIEVIQEEVKPLTLPKGMTYQGTAKKVELHADHFRVYF
jgi:hypothetical protein